MDRPFGAARSVSQAFDSTSSSVYLGTYGVRANEIRITSGSGNDVCFLAMGGSGVTAAVTDFPVLPGTIEVLTKPPGVTHIALIAAGADTGTLYITGGEGAGPAVFFISGSASVSGTVDSPLTPVAYTGTAGTTPYTFSATGLPAGLHLNATGTLYGTPTEEVTEDVVVRAVDAVGNVATLTVSIAIAGSSYHADAVHFASGTSIQSDGLTTSDSPLGLFSFLFKCGANGATPNWSTQNGGFWELQINASSGDYQFTFDVWDTDNSLEFYFQTDPITLDPDLWHSCQIALDTNHPAGEKIAKIVVDRVDRTVAKDDFDGAFSCGWAQDADNTILLIGNPGGDTAEMYVAFGQYLDLSIPANVAKFVDADNKPVNLGADGSTPTGTAAAIYLTGPAADFLINNGTAGNFSLTGGTITDATSPSD